jgi:hypothetical protein
MEFGIIPCTVVEYTGIPYTGTSLGPCAMLLSYFGSCLLKFED